jgi:hypothetical protein
LRWSKAAGQREERAACTKTPSGLSQQLIKDQTSAPHKPRANRAEEVLRADLGNAFRGVYIRTEQFAAKKRTGPCPEVIHELLRQRIGKLTAVVIAFADLCMMQTDDHESAGYGAACLPGPRHAGSKSSGNAQCCLAIQTGTPAVRRQDGLRSGEAIKEQGEGLLNALAHEKSPNNCI